MVAALALACAGCGSSGEGHEGQAETHAAPPNPHTPFSVAAAADIGVRPQGRATLQAMARQRPQLYLGLGDLSYAGPQSEREFCDLVLDATGDDAPFALLAGNHEEDTGGDGQILEFADCLPDRVHAVGTYGVQYYFDVGRLARFVMISPDLTIDEQHYYYGLDDDGGETPQLQWLKDAITGANDAGIQWVIVGMHKPCISVGEYYCDVYQDLFTTLIDERVDLVISGHDHSYQRSHQISTAPGCAEVTVDHFDPDCIADDDGSFRQGAGSIFLIAGTGGESLYRVNSGDPEAGYFAATMGRNSPRPEFGYLDLELSADRLSGRFVGTGDGGFTDRFSISR